MATLRLFGSPVVEGVSAAHESAVAQRRRVALLAFLAGHGDVGVSRDRIIATLWPDLDADRARHALANAVYALRKALGPGALRACGTDALCLDPDRVGADLWEFRHALESGDLEAAVGRCDAPFLEGFYLPDSPPFEEWLEGERQRIAGACAGALESLAEAAELRGDFATAVAWWKRRAALDPFCSRSALRLMKALAASGDVAGALRHARVHEALLREELAMEPDPALGAWAQDLMARGPVARIEAVAPAHPALAGHAGVAPPEAGAPPSAARGRGAAEGEEPPRRRSIRRPVLAGLLLSVAAAPVLWALRPEAPVDAEPPIRSLAVLPLENCTPDPRRPGQADPEEEYFADGLTDALITEVAQIPDLRVISRTSSMRFKGTCGARGGRDRSMSEIAGLLGVDAVVEGTVVRDGGRVRVNAQLIRAATDEHLWAGGLEYERDLRDVLGLQAEIVRAIARSVRSTARPDDEPVDARVRPMNPDAYAAYLKGRYHWDRHLWASHETALEHFRQAVALDPGFAPAYSGLADVYVHLDEWGGQPERGANQMGMRAARQALALDDRLAEAHASLAHLLMHEERWQEAEEEFRRALELDPSNVNARILYAFYLSAWERHGEAHLNAVRALEADPLGARTLSFAAHTFHFARRYDEAIAQWQALLSLYPDAHHAYFNIAAAHLQQGREAEGMRWARQGAERVDAPWARVHLARALAMTGDTSAATLARATIDAAADSLDPLLVAQALTATGDPDGAFEWLRRARRGNHGWLMFLRVEPAWDPLRSDPRFDALLREMRLPEGPSGG